MANKVQQPKLSDEEIAELKDAFSIYDTNKDGFINKTELRTIMQQVNIEPTDQELEDMIKEVDTDQDKKINFPEFLKMMVEGFKKNKSQVSSDLYNTFRLFDRNGDGLITHSEMKCTLEHLGEPMSDLEIDEMIKAADTDGDGQVNYQEFLSIMKKNPKESC